MIHALILAAMLIQAPVQKTLPFAWGQASGAHVEVQETTRKVPFEYGFDLKIYPDGDGSGVVVKQTNFELKAAAKLDLRSADALESMREWIVQKKHLPSIRADELGAFEEYTNAKKVETAFLDEMTEGYSALELKVARLEYLNPAYQLEWFAPLRKQWYRWSELWTGLPCQTGSRSQKRRAYLNLPQLEWMDVITEVEVGERYVEDGVELVRVQSEFYIDNQQMGNRWIAFMRSQHFNPSNILNLKNYKVVFRDTAIFNTETWLPIEIASRIETSMFMETSRAEWVEDASEEHLYRFDWTMRTPPK